MDEIFKDYCCEDIQKIILKYKEEMEDVEPYEKYWSFKYVLFGEIKNYEMNCLYSYRYRLDYFKKCYCKKCWKRFLKNKYNIVYNE